MLYIFHISLYKVKIQKMKYANVMNKLISRTYVSINFIAILRMHK